MSANKLGSQLSIAATRGIEALNQEVRDAAEKEVEANAKQIAHTMTPFYGEAAAQKFLGLLDINYGAVRAYSEATVAGDTRRQHAALARLESNADDIADFLSHLFSLFSHLSGNVGRRQVGRITSFKIKLG